MLKRPWACPQRHANMATRPIVALHTIGGSTVTRLRLITAAALVLGLGAAGSAAWGVSPPAEDVPTAAMAVLHGTAGHAGTTDPNQPPIGAAGARLACGVIGIAKPKA